MKLYTETFSLAPLQRLRAAICSIARDRNGYLWALYDAGSWQPLSHGRARTRKAAAEAAEVAPTRLRLPHCCTDLEIGCPPSAAEGALLAVLSVYSTPAMATACRARWQR